MMEVQSFHQISQSIKKKIKKQKKIKKIKKKKKKKNDVNVNDDQGDENQNSSDDISEEVESIISSSYIHNNCSETEKKKVDCLSKGLAIYYMIKLNKNAIFTITETKLTKDKEYFFRSLFENEFWVHFNNFDESKGGTITLVPRFYSIEKVEVLEKGMVSLTVIKLKEVNQFELKLVTFYNPEPKTHKHLVSSTFAKFNRQENVLISGDFNECIDIDIDYESKKPQGIKSSTRNNKTERAKKFLTEIVVNKFQFIRHAVPFTYESSKAKSAIDWFFFDEQMAKMEPSLKKIELPFNADHWGNEITFKVPMEKVTLKSKKAFRPPDEILRNIKFQKKAQKIVNKIAGNGKMKALDKLETICKKISGLAFNFRRSINDKIKTKFAKLFEKFMSEKYNFESKIDLIETSYELLKSVRQQFTKRKIENETSKGATKELSRYLRKNNKEKNIKSPDFLYDEEGIARRNVEAANLAMREMEKLYTSESICFESADKLDYGKVLSEECKRTT
jgi:hypothetical protein